MIINKKNNLYKSVQSKHALIATSVNLFHWQSAGVINHINDGSIPCKWPIRHDTNSACTIQDPGNDKLK